MSYVSPSQMVGQAIMGTTFAWAAVVGIVRAATAGAGSLATAASVVILCVVGAVGLAFLALASTAASNLEDALDRPDPEPKGQG